MKKNSKIFIQGHKGLIGSAIHNNLITNGYTNLIICEHKELDLTDNKKVSEFFNKSNIEIVIMAAGKVGGINENQSQPFEFLFKNLSIQLNTFSAAIKNNVKKIIFFGSSCMYPKFCRQPMEENFLNSGELERSSMGYAIAKLSGLELCLSYNKQYKENRFIPLIPNSVYGPNDNFKPNQGHVLSSLIQKFHKAKLQNHNEVELWGSGSPRREFLHSSDLANAVLKILEQDKFNFEFPINIGTSKDYSIKELANKIYKIVDYKGKIVWNKNKIDGTYQKLLDSSKILSLGWRPKVELDYGLRSTYDWYLKNSFII